jgi:DNA-binding MarR family transcriptional regulator
MGDNGFDMTPHRAKILSVLLRGDIVDQDGQCTTLLMAETGHRTSNALSGVLLSMEKAGLVERDKAGRRTYRIALTRQGRKLAQSLAGGAPAEAAPEAPALAAAFDGAVDLDLLAGVLLKKALLATQAQEDSAAAKAAAAQLRDAHRRIVELEDELRAVSNEAAELRAVVKTLEHNNGVLTAQMDKVRQSPGTPVKDLISRTELRELDKLMKSLPAAR